MEIDQPQRPGPTDYDAELRWHNEVLRRACGVRGGERVLDIGCGAGLTTRQAARAAGEGSALGVDVSPRAIERARELARVEGVRNVAFEHADAQVHRFPAGSFDLVMSRFGTMFFGDPAAAFANIGQALRAGGRLVMIVWQAQDRNEWNVALHESLGADDHTTLVPAGLDPFSLADPGSVTRLLEPAGFVDVAFTEVREPMYFGADVPAALDWVKGFTCTSEALARLGPAAAARATDRLRDALAAHLTRDGVCFDSRAWIVSAAAAG